MEERPEYNPAQQLEAARRVNAEGLQLALAGKFNAALGRFNSNEVGEAMQNVHGAEADLVRATTRRDAGFTLARAAVHNGLLGLIGPTDFDTLTELPDDDAVLRQTAMGGLELARRITAPYSAVDRKPYDGGQKNLATKRMSGEPFSSHSATLGCMLRVILASQVLSGKLTLDRPASKEVIDEQWLAGVARRLALAGDDAYIAVSVAMNGARAERMNGGKRILNVPSWLGRAAMGVTRGVLTARTKEDFKNVAAAVKTAARLTPDVISRKRAFESVGNWRTI